MYRFEKPKEGEADEARKSSMCLGAHLHAGSMVDLATAMQVSAETLSRFLLSLSRPLTTTTYFFFFCFRLGYTLGVACVWGLGQSVGWSQCRVMYLYGTVVADGPEVLVEAMYEPPQEGRADGFTLLDDPREEQVRVRELF